MEKPINITYEDPDLNLCGNSLKASTSNPFASSSKNKKLVSDGDVVGTGNQIVVHDLKKLASPSYLAQKSDTITS